MSSSGSLELPTRALLSTKLFVPRAHPLIVHRPRLVARLIEGLSRRLTVISAPPGSGKTTLISAWHASELGENVPLAWLTLDDGDNDPQRFATYVVAALATLQPDESEEYERLVRAASSLDINHTFVLLLNLVGNIPARFVLVIDDYQVIENAEIHESMNFLISNAPQTMRLVVVSRTDPPLALARWRVRNQLGEIRTPDLRFTTEEVEEFLRVVAGIDAELGDAALLAERTDGWAAGLQLASLALQSNESIGEQLREFGGSHRFVADYLLEEVVRRQPRYIQDFLLRTSVLDRLTAELCDRVLGVDGSAAHIRHIERHNLFLVPLDADRKWYRYHALFRELLARQLSQTYPEDVKTLNHRAASWFRAAGIGSEAVEYALRAGDLEFAADVLDADDAAIQALDQGQLATVLRWLEAVGNDVRFRHPKLNGVVIWSLISSGRIEEIEPYVDDVERFGETIKYDPILAPTIFGVVGAGRTALAVHRRDFTTAIQLSNEALQLLPPELPIARANTLYGRGFALGITGDLGGSVEAFREATQTLGPRGSMPFLMLTHTAYAQGLYHQARLAESERVLRSLLEVVRQAGLGEWSYVGFVRICLARVLLMRGQLEEALHEAGQGIQLAARWNTGTFELEGHFVVAAIQIAMGNPAAAREPLDQASRLVPMTGANPVLGRLEGLRLFAGETPVADQTIWATALLAAMPRSPEEVWPWLPAGWLAVNLAIQGGAVAQARQASESMLRCAIDGHWRLMEVMVRIALARCLWQEDDQGGALALLGPAIAVAASECLLQPFLDGGNDVATMLAALEVTGAEAEWRSQVVAAQTPAQPQRDKVNSDGVGVELAEPLSPREIEVLEQIGLGKPNSQIALDLFIAEGTVKRHTHNIYSKLGVSNRTKAVARASELGILP